MFVSIKANTGIRCKTKSDYQNKLNEKHSVSETEGELFANAAW